MIIKINSKYGKPNQEARQRYKGSTFFSLFSVYYRHSEEDRSTLLLFQLSSFDNRCFYLEVFTE